MFYLLLSYLRVGIIWGLVLTVVCLAECLTNLDHEFPPEEEEVMYDLYYKWVETPVKFAKTLVAYIILWPFYVITNLIAFFIMILLKWQ